MIITGLIDYINDALILINFVCHLTIFLGGFYVALHSRVMPTWSITCIWYIGVSSFLSLLTIIFDWIQGPSFEFSYTILGKVTDSFLHINIAILVVLLFFHTVYKDYKGMRNRNDKLESGNF